MLTLEITKEIADRARKAAAEQHLLVSIAIVDQGAHPLYFERMNDAMIGSAEAAMRKARCAVLFRRPTKVFEDALAAGRSGLLSLPDAMPIEGGVPLMRNEILVGGIGVSGGTAQQDGQVADAAASFAAEKAEAGFCL